jgi:hypothetical protein
MVMQTYDVTITVRITKTYRVEADNEDDAVMAAHERFDVNCDDTPEEYEQDTNSVSVVDEEDEE